MIILLDTSTDCCQLRTIDGNKIHDYEWDAGRTLARYLLRFLQEKTGGLTNISAIGVFRGPGSFTGLRIGMAVANPLADNLNIPIVGETSDQWRERAVYRLARGENDRIVMPLYGSPAHITVSKK